MIFQMRLAGCTIEVNCRYDLVFSVCRQFSLPRKEWTTPSILINTTQDDFTSEIVLEEHDKKLHHHQGMYNYLNPARLEIQIVCRKIAEAVPMFNAVFMHGAVVCRQGMGFMFTGPSGIGKTTRARLWLNEFPDSFVLNGDKPFIRKSGENLFVCGSPWNGKEGWGTNTEAPLRAVFFLKRIEDTEPNSVTELSLEEAFADLLHQTYAPESPYALLNTVKLIKGFKNKVRLYRLCSNPTPAAIRMAWEAADV